MQITDPIAAACLKLAAERCVRYEFVDGAYYPIRSDANAKALTSTFLGFFGTMQDGHTAAALQKGVRIGPERLYYPECVVYPTSKPDTSEPTTEPLLVMTINGLRDSRFERHDRRFEAFKTIPSLRHYLKFDLTGARVWHWRPCEDGLWRVEVHIRGQQRFDNPLEVAEFGIRASLTDLYSGTDVPDRPGPPNPQI